MLGRDLPTTGKSCAIYSGDGHIPHDHTSNTAHLRVLIVKEAHACCPPPPTTFRLQENICLGMNEKKNIEQYTRGEGIAQLHECPVSSPSAYVVVPYRAFIRETFLV